MHTDDTIAAIASAAGGALRGWFIERTGNNRLLAPVLRCQRE